MMSEMMKPPRQMSARIVCPCVIVHARNTLDQDVEVMTMEPYRLFS